MQEKRKKAFIIKAATTAALMILFLFFVLSACSQKKIIKSVSLCYSFPTSVYKENNEIKIYTLRDTILIFYYSDYVIYRLPAMVKFETEEKIKGTEPYFIYKRQDSIGVFFSSLTDSSGITCDVDSFLFNRGFKVKDLDIPANSMWSLIEAKRDKDGILIEKYGVLNQGDDMSVDSIYYYYSAQMNKIEYSFSKRLDSLRAMKLFKTRLLFNSKFSATNRGFLPKREISFEIKEENSPDQKDIFSLVKKYQSLKKE